jgi:hypothetical protein
MSFSFNEDFINTNLNSNIYDNVGITLLDGRIIPPTPPVPPVPPTPISIICFQKNTPILTDQGIIPIDKINTKIHTIRGNKIIAITKTISIDNYLVCFEKNSLKFNYPCKKTIMSKDHKLYYNGKLTEAYKFIELFPNVTKIQYNGDILYNILMEKHDIINVNNLICETLHPDNIIAKIFTSNLSEEHKNSMIIINNSIMKKNYNSTKKRFNISNSLSR